MKKIKILLISLILILGGIFFSTTYAAETKDLKVLKKSDSGDNKYIRPFTEMEYKYSVDSLYYTIVKIYEDAKAPLEGTDIEKAKASSPFYCLRRGIGFGANDYSDVSESSVQYEKVGEMHTDIDKIISKYNEVYTDKANADSSYTKSINGKDVNIYNAILWILDEAYLPNDKMKAELEGEKLYDEAKYKEELLTKAGIPLSEQANITKDDIEAVQQLAIWYFSNCDESLGNINSLKINEIDNIDRKDNLYRLYKYLVLGAADNSSVYGNGESRELVNEKRTFDKEVKLGIESVDGIENDPHVVHPENHYYKIGPFKINGTVNDDSRDSIKTSDILLLDNEGNKIERYYFLVQDEAQNKYVKNEIYYFTDSGNQVVNDLKPNIEYYINVKKTFTKGFTLGSGPDLIPSEYKYDMSKVVLKLYSSTKKTTATFYVKDNASQPVVELDKEYVSSFDELTTEKPKEFDLSLRKFITSINDVELVEDSREPSINTETLENGIVNRRGETEYTATYTHPKDPILVETGNTVVYTIRVYNEGELDGTATQITDYLPSGLELAEDSDINDIYKWSKSPDDERIITSDYLNNKVIKHYDSAKTQADDGENWQKAAVGNGGLYYEDLKVECNVVAEAEAEDINLRNIAAITGDSGDDRDSEPVEPDLENYNPEGNNSTYQEDDDDYEDLVLKAKPFDLALRKYISSIKRNGKEVIFEDRTPKIHLDTLRNGTFNRNGTMEYTATYEHSKEPLIVKKGDIITYTLRVYNEGARSGYATEITDYIPEGLALIKDYKTNIDNKWRLPEDLDASSNVIDLIGENGFYKTEEDVKNLSLEDFTGVTSLEDVQLITGKVAITSNDLNDELIEAFDPNKTDAEEGWQKAEDEEGGLYYKDLQVTCLVIAENTYKDTITNVTAITEDKDKNGKDVIDRDSEPEDVKDPYTTWEQDDDDYEPVVLKYFDLALRKFITSVETNGNVQDVTTRVPNPTMGKDGNIEYKHDKTPVFVANNDIVTYTIRVFNEGTIAGYAEEITDDIPEGLLYLPENETNIEYGWVMVDENGEETDNVEEAVKITTDYLSEAKGIEAGRNNLIKAFNGSKEISTEEPFNPDYKDVKIAFRVIEPSTSDRIITNHAQISEDSDYDEDSIPDSWNDGEDDQDEEKVYVKYFDLSLLKWVTQTVVTVDGKTTTTETGFKPNTGKTETDGIRDNDEAEPLAKVELDKKKLDKTTVKFVYKIRITNEGEIAGYATELTDYIPEGLEFVESDNTEYGWKESGEGKVTTRALETVLLQPGESAEVEIVFRWKNSADNLGIKTNVAEISEDYNENNSSDIDSTPNNKNNPYEKEQEDDDDFAQVILSLKTGKETSYALLIITVIGTLAGGIYLIKRYVLTY